MRWLLSHKQFVILIVIISLLLSLGILSIKKGSFKGGVTSFATGFSYFGKGLGDALTSIFSYGSVVDENKELKEEVNKLKEELNRVEFKNKDLKELKELSKSLNYDWTEKAKYVTADVQTADWSDSYKVFMINRGKESGIALNDVVVSTQGVVGYISDTGNGWSEISTILDQNRKISFKVYSNLEVQGVLDDTVDGNNMSGYFFSEASGVVKGSILVTSGVGLYPKGVNIGTVTKVKKSKDQKMTVFVKPSVDFKILEKVSVVVKR